MRLSDIALEAASEKAAVAHGRFGRNECPDLQNGMRAAFAAGYRVAYRLALSEIEEANVKAGTYTLPPHIEAQMLALMRERDRLKDELQLTIAANHALNLLLGGGGGSSSKPSAAEEKYNALLDILTKLSVAGDAVHNLADAMKEAY